MKKLNGLDIYEAKINDEIDGMYTISIVDYPAVERDFVCFKEQNKEQMKFSIENEEKQNITGVVMLADTPIYRRNGDYEYYITYSKETIAKMAEKYLKDGMQNNVSLMHNGELITGINMLEIYIKDSSKGIEPNFIEDVPDGSLMATFHVEDSDLWEQIKNGDVLNGFSLEGFFSIEEKMNNNKINKDKNMSKIAKFVKSLMQFGEIATDKGNLYWDGEGELAVGVEVYVDGEEDEKIVAEDGDYKIEGKTIVVVDGKVSEINEDEVVEEQPAEETIVTLNLKQERFNKVKELYEESYEEKEHKIIEAIRSLGFDAWLIEAGEDYAVVESWNEEAGDYKHIRFSISWDAEGNPIVGEFDEVKPAFVPVEENVPEVVEEQEFSEIVISKEGEDKPEEEIEKPVESGEENTETEVPEPEKRDEKEEKIEALQAEVEGLKTEIADIRAALANIVQQPAAQPIVTEFEAVNAPKETRMSKAAKLLSSLNN